MNRTELTNALMKRFPNLTAEDVRICIQLILAQMGDSLSAGGRIEIRGFGVFYIKRRNPRRARNPRTGTLVHVGEKYGVRFKPGKELIERVDPALEKPLLAVVPKPVRRIEHRAVAEALA